MRNYSSLVNNVKMRTNPQNTSNLKALFEGLGMPYNELSEYVKLAMIGVPEEYTSKSREAANLVIAHLRRSHGSEVDFKFQGSVETNTHILSENDIDIVQISNKSYSAEITIAKTLLDGNNNLSWTESTNLKKHTDSFFSYTGDQLADLYTLRLKSENVLRENYNEVNISKPKAICVNIKKPLRNVDIVTAKEYRNVNFLKSNDDSKIGIQVYDKSTHSTLPVEYPFLSIKRINDKSNQTHEKLKKMIRFLKNLKYDAVEIIDRKPNISSFDINAITYDIPVSKYLTLSYMQLVLVVHEQLKKIVIDSDYRNNLKSVDEQEYIFRYNSEKVSEIQLLLEIVEDILTDVKTLNLIN